MAKVVESAFSESGFETFEDFLAANTGKTLRQMAEILDVKEQTLILYHSRWVDGQFRDGHVQPLRLEDDEN